MFYMWVVDFWEGVFKVHVTGAECIPSGVMPQTCEKICILTVG